MVTLSNAFVIVVPAYNAGHYLLHTLHSIVEQTFGDCGIIIRDDMSTDDTPALAARVLGLDGTRKTYTRYCGRDLLYIRNDRKYYGGGNTYDSVRHYVRNKQAVVGVVDGDDKLLDPDALRKIYRVYQEKGAWLVWSQHQATSRSGSTPAGYSGPLPPDEALYRDRNYWAVSHFRTCRAWLFDHLDRRDLRDPFTGGPFCAYAADAAFIYPLIELCGNDKSYFLDEVLYLYNDELDTNENKKPGEQVARYTHYIRNVQRRYAPLRQYAAVY
jgi:glycosyltransferase involved in cell wall biosynthesis